MKKIILFTLIFALIFTFNISAADNNFKTYLDFTSINSGSLMTLGIKTDIQDDFSLMFSANNVSTVFGNYGSFDFLGGFNFSFDAPLSDYPNENAILAGIRNSGVDNGYLIKLLGRTEYTDKIFYSGDIEYIIWQESSNAFINKIMMGYQVVDEMAVKAGITQFSAGSATEWGFSVGMENTF